MEQLELFPDESPPLLEGVQIFLERIEKFPEEINSRKWTWVYEYMDEDAALTRHEVTLLKQAITKARRGNFTSRVLQTLTEQEAKLGSGFDITNSIGYQDYQTLGKNQLSKKAIAEAQQELEKLITRRNK